MDAIRSFACDNPAISNQVENVYKLLHEVMVVFYVICKISYSSGLKCGGHALFSTAPLFTQ